MGQLHKSFFLYNLWGELFKIWPFTATSRFIFPKLKLTYLRITEDLLKLATVVKFHQIWSHW